MGIFIWPAESLSTINIIPGYFLGRLPILLLIGLLVLFLSALIYFRAQKNESDYVDQLIKLFLFFWLIIFIGFTINNYQDFKRNYYYNQYDLNKKNIIRVCDLDNVEGKLCRLFSFISLAKKDIPMGSRVQVIAEPIIKTYLIYYSFPYFEFTDQEAAAEYLLIYDTRSIIKIKP